MLFPSTSNVLLFFSSIWLTVLSSVLSTSTVKPKWREFQSASLLPCSSITLWLLLSHAGNFCIRHHATTKTCLRNPHLLLPRPRWHLCVEPPRLLSTAGQHSPRFWIFLLDCSSFWPWGQDKKQLFAEEQSYCFRSWDPLKFSAHQSIK